MFATISVIAILHVTALSKFYYWDYWWFDILMHLLGGLWVGLFIFWFDEWIKLPFKINLINFLALILAVGIAWELWELMFGITLVRGDKYVFDTILDIIMDITGGVVTYFLKNNNKNNEQVRN